MTPDGVADRARAHARLDELDDDTGDDTPTIEVCPSCRSLGEKVERVGTRQCKTRKCRVHFYQEARPQDVIE